MLARSQIPPRKPPKTTRRITRSLATERKSSDWQIPVEAWVTSPPPVFSQANGAIRSRIGEVRIFPATAELCKPKTHPFLGYLSDRPPSPIFRRHIGAC